MRESKPKKRNRRPNLALALLAAGLLALYCVINAHTVRLRPVEFGISGMSTRLDGTKILFVSDLKITDTRSGRHAGRLLRRLCRAEPDILIIGGDLTKKGDTDKKILDAEMGLDAFFMETRQISLRGGKYIVYGDSDILISDSLLRTSGFTLLCSSQIKLTLNGASLVLVGYDAGDVRKFKFNDEGTDAVIVISHLPSVSRLLPYVTDKNGKPYADLLLSGHTLGGQIIFVDGPLMYPEENAEFPNVIDEKLGIGLLVSEGIGTEDLPLRLGTEPAAYIITLKAEE